METIDKLKGSYSKRDLLYLFYKIKNLILFIFILTTILVTLGSYVVPPQYKTYSQIYIRRNIPPLPFLSPSYYTRHLERKSVISSAVELIESKAVIDKAADLLISRGNGDQKEKSKGNLNALAKFKLFVKSVRKIKNDLFKSLGLIPKVSEREHMINRVEKIDVKPQINSDIININYKHFSPRFAADVVNTVTRIYLEKHLELITRPGIYEFYNDQSKRSQSVIRKLDDEIQSFKVQTSIISAEEQKKMKLQEFISLNSTLNQTKVEKEEISIKIETSKKQIRAQPEKVIGSKAIKRNPQIDYINAKLLDLEIEKVRLKQKFSPGSRQIREIDTTIASVKRKLSQESITVVDTETVISNTIRQELLGALKKEEAEFNAKVAREFILSRQKQELEKELKQLDQNVAELKVLTRRRESAEKLYFRYFDQQEEARIADATNVNTTDVRIIRWATVPETPMYSRLFLISIGVLTGLVVGIFFALVIEFFDHSLNRKEDVEYYLNLPLIASIPKTRFNSKLLTKSR